MIRSLSHQEIDDQQPPQFSEQYLLDRLIAAGVGCLQDWRALSPRARRSVFGITTGMARALDRLAKERLEA
jgi:hypothetical protein